MKIYLTCFGVGHQSFIGYALAENGEGLASHLSSSIDFSKHDMGLTGNWKHDHYAKCFPNGYELIWIDNPETDERWQNALALNKSNPLNISHEEEKAKCSISYNQR